MEYLDYYDEEGNNLGFKTKEEIHTEGLWHNVIYFWLYDEEGNIYFQIKKDSNKFCMTSSGHVLKDETSDDALKRKVLEDLGIEIDHCDVDLADSITCEYSETLNDGSAWIDRIKVDIFTSLYKDDLSDFNFDKNNVSGIIKVNACEVLELFENEKGTIVAMVVTQDDSGKINVTQKNVSIDEFLVNSRETAFVKYGDILNKLIEEVY